jgi:transcriptional regulator with XRE-family HTH domain
VSEKRSQELVHHVVRDLKARRESVGWSQRALARKAGVDPKTVNLIERQIRSPTLLTLCLLASALEIPFWRMMKDAENNNKGGL